MLETEVCTWFWHTQKKTPQYTILIFSLEWENIHLSD